MKLSLYFKHLPQHTGAGLESLALCILKKTATFSEMNRIFLPRVSCFEFSTSSCVSRCRRLEYFFISTETGRHDARYYLFFADFFLNGLPRHSKRPEQYDTYRAAASGGQPPDKISP